MIELLKVIAVALGVWCLVSAVVTIIYVCVRRMASGRFPWWNRNTLDEDGEPPR